MDLQKSYRNINYQNLVEKYTKCTNAELFADINPGDLDHVLAKVPYYSIECADAALERAVQAFDKWSKTSPVKRGQILLKAGEIIEAEVEDFALLLTLEEGKTLNDSRAEVYRAAGLFKFYGALAFKLGGKTLPSADEDTRIYTVKEPLGAVLAITPWNFPISIPAWKIAPALAAGNTVVLKPAEKTPLIALKLLDALRRAGLPEGALEVVPGRGNVVGEHLVRSESIMAVSFTGSTEVGRHIYKTLGEKKTMNRIQLELGGKNAIYVDKTADIGKAIEIVTRSAFGLTGQSCTATSRLIVHADIYDQFMKAFIDRVKSWTVGPGWTPVDMGPVVDKEQYDKDLYYIELGKKEGAKLVYGGNPLNIGKGYYLEPTIFEGVTKDMRIFQEEIFGPVLAVTKAADLDEAIELTNAVEYGHTAGIITRDLRAAREFSARVVAGVIKINKPTIGLELQAPFGGFKASGATTWKEMGEEALEFYTKEKTIYEGLI
nr:MAG: aldehyde dehydrogenase [Thermoproteus sp. AZ2]